MTTKPEAAARAKVDTALEALGWSVQDVQAATTARCGVPIREFPLKRGHGFGRRKGHVPWRQKVNIVSRPVSDTKWQAGVRGERHLSSHDQPVEELR